MASAPEDQAGNLLWLTQKLRRRELADLLTHCGANFRGVAVVHSFVNARIAHLIYTVVDRLPTPRSTFRNIAGGRHDGHRAIANFGP